METLPLVFFQAILSSEFPETQSHLDARKQKLRFSIQNHMLSRKGFWGSEHHHVLIFGFCRRDAPHRHRCPGVATNPQSAVASQTC